MIYSRYNGIRLIRNRIMLAEADVIFLFCDDGGTAAVQYTCVGRGKKLEHCNDGCSYRTNGHYDGVPAVVLERLFQGIIYGVFLVLERRESSKGRGVLACLHAPRDRAKPVPDICLLSDTSKHRRIVRTKREYTSSIKGRFQANRFR